MGQNHDEIMAELKLIRQYVFDLQCEVDRLRLSIEAQTAKNIKDTLMYYPAFPASPVMHDIISAKRKLDEGI